MTMADMFVSRSRNDTETVAGPEADNSLFCDPRPGIAHCNFHLRGEESDADEALVRDWAAREGLPFYKADFDTAAIASQRGISIEMAARDLRYEWFASVCRSEGYDALAVAHNADDNAETFILNLLRGTGLKGICGMKARGVIPGAGDIVLLRPMLGMSRGEIVEYATRKGLQWHEDRTNTDTTIKRNLVRHSIFPLFEKINPSFRKTLASDMEHFREAYEACPPSLSSELLSEGFSGAVVDSIKEHLKEHPDSSGKRFICADKEAVTHAGNIIIRDIPSSAPEESVIIPGEGVYSFRGHTVSLQKVDRTKDFPLNQGDGILCADAALAAWPLKLRQWQKGDRMRPFGMRKGSRKLSDIFSDLHLSIPEKDATPVLCTCDGRIAAIIGYRIDDHFKITDATSSVLVIREL